MRIICNERVVEFGTKGTSCPQLPVLVMATNVALVPLPHLDCPRFVTDKGTTIEASLAFLSTGIVPNSSFLRDGLLAPYLDPK